jgi:tetratricopeptide (TPR) repeat protein
MLNPQHPRAFRYSIDLSSTLKRRYEALGNPADYELALFHARCALNLVSPDRPPKLLRDVATVMGSMAEYSGDIEVLSEGISLAREALGGLHESHKFRALETLGEFLIIKALHFGDIEDLEEGIHHMRQMLKCLDQETLHYTDGVVYVTEALLQYYEMDPTLRHDALTEAIDLLARVKDGNIPEVYRARALHSRAKAYRAQYYHSGCTEMLKMAFAINQQALDLRPRGHPLRCTSLAALSEDLVQLSTTTENMDLESIIGMLNEALRDIAEGHPDLVRVTVSLAKLLLIPDTPQTNFKGALSSLSRMLRSSPGSAYRSVVDVIPVLRSVETRLPSEWTANSLERQQCLDVYQALINLLPRLASVDLNLPRRIQVLSQARDLATKASSHAIILKQFGRSVELLESGRAVFWAQHLRLRTSFDSLHHDVAKELCDISRRLEATANSKISLSLDSNIPRGRMESLMNDRRRLSARFDQLVNEVRMQPGMERFLRNLDYKDLSSAATHGPVVILQPSCMCVITTPYVDPHIIPLHGVTDEWLQGAVNTLHLTTRKSRNRLDERGARRRLVNEVHAHHSDGYEVLADIWRRIVQPLLDFLGWEVSQAV